MDFVIKGLEGQYITIDVKGYSYPESNDDWDRNWLVCSIKAETPGFLANFGADLRTDEIDSFYTELKELYKNMSGSASLVGMEGNVDIQVQIDRLGKLNWKVAFIYPSGYGATLEFEMESEQSYLNELIRRMKKVMDEYPIRPGGHHE